MKECPFKKKTKITKGIKKSYQHPYDKIETKFGECTQDECMTYDAQTKKCKKIK